MKFFVFFIILESLSLKIYPQDNLDVNTKEATINTLNEMLNITRNKLQELDTDIERTEETVSRLNAVKIKFSESATIAGANGLSKEQLKTEITKLKDFQYEAEKVYTAMYEKIGLYKQFREANVNAIKSIYENKNKTAEFNELIKKNVELLKTFKNKIRIFNKKINNIKTFINLVPNWEKIFTKSIQYKIKNTTFKWDPNRLLISWSRLLEAYDDLIKLSKILWIKFTDYKPNNTNSAKLKNFFTVFVYITLLMLTISILLVRKLSLKNPELNSQNFMLLTLLSAISRNKWLLTALIYVSIVLLSYYFIFQESVKFIYLLVWWCFGFYNLWKLGKTAISIIIIERHGQLEGLTEEHRKSIGHKIIKLYFMSLILATMLIPGYFYSIQSTLYNLVLYILMLVFLIFLINTLWSININAFVISRSKKIRLVAKATRFILLVIMSTALLSFLVEATGFVTLSSTVQQLLLGNMIVIVIAWVVYILLSQTVDALNKQLITSDLTSSSTRIILRNFLSQLVGFSVFTSAILLIIKTWTISFLGTTDIYELSIITVNQYKITVGDGIQILIIYFVYRLIYVLLAYFWDSFFIDYLNVNIKFRANFLTLAKYFLIVLFFITAAGVVGFTYKNFVIIFGALGVGIGFGLQNIANDFISGIILLFERPLHVGDILDIDGQIAQVIKIGSRSTTVITDKKSTIVIPNSHLVSKKLENLTPTENTAAFTVQIGVDYNSDIKLVRETLENVLKKNELISKKTAPAVMLKEFADSSIIFTVKFWATKPLNAKQIKSTVMFDIEDAFKEAGIKIPFPQHVIHFADTKIEKKMKTKKNG